MRAVVGWLAGLLGVAALASLIVRHRRQAPPPVATESVSDPVADDLADELRRKLDEHREAEEASSPEAEAVAEAPSSLDDRRAEVHARAREAIDALTPDAD